MNSLTVVVIFADHLKKFIEIQVPSWVLAAVTPRRFQESKKIDSH